ncbi:hypothetical protein AVEN_30185-1 [Araneus ventricosus]|uniref:Uncharacterized protein n=1 Tax=Araneus ventricosus TaxID=182803 RepID=A0A4Y2DST6_ARAVE|nr:hypothetical protein AVEN_30185-1 [Araneus ventricosus]
MSYVYYKSFIDILKICYSPPPGSPSPGPRLPCLRENDQRDEEGCSEGAEEHRRLPTSHESTVIRPLRPCLSLARHTPAFARPPGGGRSTPHRHTIVSVPKAGCSLLPE